jgi:hypothetical protein
VIRHQTSQEEEDAERSVQERRWAESMQKMLVKSMCAFSSAICPVGKVSISSNTDEAAIFALFTWDYTFHMICEQGIANSNLDLNDLEYSFYNAIAARPHLPATISHSAMGTG